MVEATEAKTRAPKCLDGAGACPPEDCGGPPGYADVVAILADSAHPDRRNTVEWLDAEFDPAKFDIAEVNALLRQL